MASVEQLKMVEKEPAESLNHTEEHKIMKSSSRAFLEVENEEEKINF